MRRRHQRPQPQLLPLPRPIDRAHPSGGDPAPPPSSGILGAARGRKHGRRGGGVGVEEGVGAAAVIDLDESQAESSSRTL